MNIIRKLGNIHRFDNLRHGTFFNNEYLKGIIWNDKEDSNVDIYISLKTGDAYWADNKQDWAVEPNLEAVVVLEGEE